MYSLLDSLMMPHSGRSRAINGENLRGEKGQACLSDGGLGAGRKGSPCLNNIKPSTQAILMDIDGPGVIRHIWITVAEQWENEAFLYRDLVLRMYWDGEDFPSVETPLGDFFCCGFGRYTQIGALPICVNPTRAMNCYFPMPFKSHAKITIENQSTITIPSLFFQIDYQEFDEIPEESLYFHALWQRERTTKIREDYTILTAEGKGQYVGTYFAISTLQRYWWGEGEFKFFLDGDTKNPTISSTGTEDYFGGAWSFGKQEAGVTKEATFCSPYSGFPYFSRNDPYAQSPYFINDQPTERGLYRFHILDPILFEHDLRVDVQQIGANQNGLFERQDDVSSVAYWYQAEPHLLFPTLLSVTERKPR